MFRKPPLGNIHAFLRRRNALIIHFSGVPGAGNTSLRYPEDLRRVITDGANSGVSCSVVTPDDIFAGTGERNAYGTIGVILDLHTEQSLATATPGDGGSLWSGEGPRDFDEKDLTIEDLERSLADRQGHNEWGVRDFIVRGIFVIDPVEIWGAVQTPFGVDEGIIPYSIDLVRADFPGQRIYSFAEGAIVELHPHGQRSSVQHEELYP
jgi:hypothetical protein